MRSDYEKEMELWYESLDPTLRRRDFLKVLGGGVVVFIAGGSLTALAEMAPQRRSYPTEPSAYVRIGEDGRVTIFSGKGSVMPASTTMPAGRGSVFAMRGASVPPRL